MFVKKKPLLKDFENELQKYNMAKSQLTTEKGRIYWKQGCQVNWPLSFTKLAISGGSFACSLYRIYEVFGNFSLGLI